MRNAHTGIVTTLALAVLAALASCTASPSDQGESSVRAIRYRLSVTESGMDAMHGNFHRISEIYLPDYGVAFNVFNNKMNAFPIDLEARRKLYSGTIDFSGQNEALHESALHENTEQLRLSLEMAERVVSMANLTQQHSELQISMAKNAELRALLSKAILPGTPGTEPTTATKR